MLMNALNNVDNSVVERLAGPLGTWISSKTVKRLNWAFKKRHRQMVSCDFRPKTLVNTSTMACFVQLYTHSNNYDVLTFKFVTVVVVFKLPLKAFVDSTSSSPNINMILNWYISKHQYENFQPNLMAYGRSFT